MKNVNRFFTLGFRGSLFRRTVAVIVWGLLLTRAEPGRTQDIFGTGENEFSIEFVEIGNPGNPDDSGTTGSYHTPHGGVSTSFRMGTYEISRDMISKANAASGKLGINLSDMSSFGGNGATRPGTGVSWNEAARFVNWLNTSSGYSEAYKFALQPDDVGYSANANIELWQSGDAGYDTSNPYRNANAYYFLPSEDEWYKAAYYSGTGSTYYDYALGSDSIPGAVSGGTTAGTAVYGQSFSTGPADITNAGGLNPYGVMGMNGNVWEWNENPSDGVNYLTNEARGVRGGNWVNTEGALQPTFRGDGNPADENIGLGFRVASKAVHTIAFDEIGDQFTTDTVTLDATANSVLPVSFTVTGPATLVENELSFTGTGIVEVTATQEGDDYWIAATPVVRSFVVSVPLIKTQESFGTAGNEFSIEFVEVGNAGNADDDGAGGGSTSSPHGGVAYAYRISTYEISQSDIDKAAASGLLQVTAGAHSGNQPAANITWYEAAAFVNWMNTSEGYHAAYDLTFSGEWSMTVWEASEQASTGVDGGTNPYRHRHAYYFLPGEDEWYKAAYHWNDGVTANYWDYATGGNLPPAGVAGGTAFGSAVYGGQSDPADVDLAGGLSPYGTMGQNGNVWEWTESASDGVNDSSSEGRAFRSGGWLDAGENNLRSSSRQSGSPAFEVNDVGFRVAGLIEAPPAVQTLAFDEINGQLATDTVTLAATASSELPVSFAVTGPAILVENELSFTGPGTVEVTASQAGDDNWIAATPVLRSFAVFGVPFTTRDSFGTDGNEFSLDFVDVGNPGNADDTGDGGGSYSSLYGGVAYAYRMSTYEISQSVIDKATASGLLHVTSGAHTDNQPAGNMDWYEAAAFVNWMNTSEGYHAAYDLSFDGVWSMELWPAGERADTGMDNGTNPYRHKDAFYFLPSEDEWYKAAYHWNDGVTANYWDYATASNTIPIDVSSGSSSGTAVFDYNDVPADVTLAGGLSPYGTMGQNGNIWEMLESAFAGNNNSTNENRGYRGASWSSGGSSLRSSFRGTLNPGRESNNLGFRVASVAVQTIDFAAIDDQLTTHTVTLGASANSGLPVSFAVTGPVTRTGDSLSFTGPGTVEVTASQAGDAYWNPAADVVRTFEVTFPAEITGISPDQANIGGGIEVVISGNALGDGANIAWVRLAGVHAMILSQTTDSVTVRVRAAGSAGLGDVEVASMDGETVTFVDGFEYLWLAAPVQLDPVDITPTGLAVRWEPVPGADRYLLDVGDIYFKTYLSGFEKRNVAQATRQPLTDLNPDWYAIRLYAENASGLSLPSRTVRVPTGSNIPYPTNPPGSGPASQGGVLLFNPASMFHGAGMVYEVESSDVTLVNALITPEGKLRLEMLEPGVAFVTLTATDPESGYTSSQVLRIEVVADQPEVESNTIAALGSGTLLFTQTVLIRNTSGVDALGVRVLFSDLAPGTTIQNWTGEAGDGRPFLDVGADFPADGTLSFDIVYRATTSPEVSPPTLEFDYILTDIRPPLPEEGTRITRQRIIQVENALMLFEFSSRPGELYVVEYMNNFPDGDWIEVSLQPRAGTNRTQWIDSGPPTTTPIEGVRVYRVKPIDE